MALLSSVAQTLRLLLFVCEAASWLSGQRHQSRMGLIRALRSTSRSSTLRICAARPLFSRVVDATSLNDLISTGADQPVFLMKPRATDGPTARTTTPVRTPGFAGHIQPNISDVCVDQIAAVSHVHGCYSKTFLLVREADTIALLDVDVMRLSSVMRTQETHAMPSDTTAASRHSGRVISDPAIQDITPALACLACSSSGPRRETEPMVLLTADSDDGLPTIDYWSCR
jgi:hypothetical protein